MRKIFASSPGWNWSGPTLHPQPDAVHALPDARHRGKEQQPDRGDPEEVAVGLEHAVVVPERDEHAARAATPTATQTACLPPSCASRR